MRTELMFLLFGRQRYSLISVAGEEHRIAKTSDDPRLEYWRTHVRPEAERRHTEAQQTWLAAREEFFANTHVRRHQEQQGPRGNRTTVTRSKLTTPNGAEIECAQQDEQHRIDAEYRRLHPEPHDTSSFQTWAAEQNVSVREVRGWVGHACRPDGELTPLDEALENSDFGAPIQSITRILNRYAADGWAVASVHEDKGLYTGADAGNESYPTRIRYLLTRTSDPGELPTDNAAAGPAAATPAV